MTARNIVWGRAATAAIFALTLAGTARAQSTAGATPPPTSPLILERVENGFILAPDFKVTDVDDRFARLAGVYGGWVTDDTLMIGAGGYWLADGSDDLEMAYGGLVSEWLTARDHRIRFGVKGLVGAGRATLSDTIDLRPVTEVFGRFGRDVRVDRSRISTSRQIRFRETFFVFEPQASVLIAVTRHIGLNWSVGYRVIGDAGRLRDRLEGVSGSVALRLGLH